MEGPLKRDLCLMDWDDTQYPTTYLNELQVDLDKPNDTLVEVLRAVDVAVTALALGNNG